MPILIYKQQHARRPRSETDGRGVAAGQEKSKGRSSSLLVPLIRAAALMHPGLTAALALRNQSRLSPLAIRKQNFPPSGYSWTLELS